VEEGSELCDELHENALRLDGVSLLEYLDERLHDKLRVNLRRFLLVQAVRYSALQVRNVKQEKKMNIRRQNSTR
jgi:hypothetical protein